MIVVADTSVILNLCRVQHADLLPSLFGDVWIPETVRDEFQRLGLKHPRFSGVTLPSWIRVLQPTVIPRSVATEAGLHPGERAALALALEIKADALLIDESAGRRVAGRLGLHVMGLAGVLLRARESGLIPAVSPVIDQLETEAGFWLAPAVKLKILRLAKESPP